MDALVTEDLVRAVGREREEEARRTRPHIGSRWYRGVGLRLRPSRRASSRRETCTGPSDRKL